MVHAKIMGIYNNAGNKSSKTSSFTPEGAIKPSFDIDNPDAYTQNNVNRGWNCIGVKNENPKLF